MSKVKTAVDVEVGDIWASKSTAERKAWLKKAQQPETWDTTTFEDLPDEVQAALEAAK